MQSCPNCSTPVTGRYCPTCGQRQGVVHTSITRVVRDVLEDQFSLDATLPRTLAALFFQPGLLTREYMSLRIARYVPPLRLYLACSVIFFLFLSVVSTRNIQIDPETMALVDSARAAQRAQVKSGADTVSAPLNSDRFGVFTDDLRPGSWYDRISVNLGNERLNQLVRARLLELRDLPPQDAFRELARSFLRQIPKVMFLLLPVYALLLKLLYLRRKRFFVEHFIFALHVHAFVFLALLVLTPLRNVTIVAAALLLWIPVYTLLALKKVYGQGWIKTSFKWLALGNAYIVILCFGVILGMLLALVEL